MPDTAPTVDELRLLQPPSARTGRAVRAVRITVADGEPFDVTLGPESLESTGQVVPIPAQSVSRLHVELTGVGGGTPDDPYTPVGLAEIGVGSTEVAEVVRLPVELLDRVGADLDGHGLDIVLSRLRLDLPGTDRLDDESHLDRRFEIPLARSFQLQGTARAAGGTGAFAAAPAQPCRDDLLSVDGRPLPVRLTPSTGPTGGSTSLTSCAPVDVDAGNHRLTATTGRVTGWDIDQVVLSTDGDGLPSDVATRGAPSALAPPVRTTDASPAAVEAEVDSDGMPFWFVLGQSAGEGWAVDVDGATVGQRTLVDGLGNGWVLTPDGPGTLTVHLRWEPQRQVWVGMAASGIAVLACGVILLRRRPGAMPSLRAAPVLRSPATSMPQPAATVALATAIVASAALVVATPSVAVAAGVLTVLAGLVSRGRVVLLVTAPAALIASRVIVERPALAWLALAVVAADLLLSRREVTPSG